MGVTIHYSGQLKDPRRMDRLLAFVREFVSSHEWTLEIIPGKNDSVCSGFVVLPHHQCEPLRIEFGPRYRFQDWVKTQFAGPETHIEVIRFLKQIQPILGQLRVRDEGEYWETGDEETLRGHLGQINEVIAEMIAGSPGARSQVREPNGHIADLIQ